MDDAAVVGILWKVVVAAIGLIQVLLTAWGIYVTRSVTMLQREHLQFQLYVAQNYATKDEYTLAVSEINRKMDKLMADVHGWQLRSVQRPVSAL